jgi:cob(I)alamin adenosyltransferase
LDVFLRLAGKLASVAFVVEAGARANRGDNMMTDSAARPPTDSEAMRDSVRQARKKKGLVIVNTGNGKGKTTAALGVLLRAWGRGMKVGGIQFIKNEGARYGEIKAIEQMGNIDWVTSGDGFTWTSKDMDETVALARHGWQQAQEFIASGGYDVVILDEFTYTMHYGWLDTAEVVAWLRENKPDMLHLIITGRSAPDALVEYADLVTEMRVVKHPFKEQGIHAQAGIEF